MVTKIMKFLVASMFYLLFRLQLQTSSSQINHLYCEFVVQGVHHYVSLNKVF